MIIMFVYTCHMFSLFYIQNISKMQTRFKAIKAFRHQISKKFLSNGFDKMREYTRRNKAAILIQNMAKKTNMTSEFIVI